MSRVTVLMPAYNVGPWIREAIESVLAQTFKDFTLLVIDDCSTDDTAEVVRSFSDPRIRYEKNEHNLGLAENLNRGLDLSNTEFCARMDGDDIAEPTWLETGVKVLDSRPEVGICSFGFQFFGTRTSQLRFPEFNEDSKAQMLFGCTIIVPVFRRSLMAKNGLRYRTEMFPAEDYDMWSRCYRITQVYNVQKTMFHYRMHPTQISTSKAEAQRQKSNLVKLYMLEWLNPDFSEEEKQFFLEKFCRIGNLADLKQTKAFAKLLVMRNTQGHFSTPALEKRFRYIIGITALNYAENNFFAKGHNPVKFLKLLFSGFYFTIPLEHRYKILVKSLLFH